MTIGLGRLQPVDPREVWASEPADFTPWLRDNADSLAEAIGLDLEISASEHPVGPFSVDLIGRDVTNNCVLVIENQMTSTDHVHLGQLVTYAANTDAATVIWTALSFREEHRQAIEFLNTLGGERARFFAVEIGAVRIGDSAPAPLFKVVAQPNDFHAQVSLTAQVSSQGNASGRGALYQSFWQRFLERVHADHPNWTRATKAQAQNWMTLASKFRGSVYWSINFPSERRLRCELYIDSSDPLVVEERFNFFLEHRAEIEASFAGELSFEPLEGRRASRIAAYGTGAIESTDEYDSYLDWFVDTLGRLKRALDPLA